MRLSNALGKWLTIGIGVKRWVLLLLIGILLIAVSLVVSVLKLMQPGLPDMPVLDTDWAVIIGAGVGGFALAIIAPIRLSYNLLAPYRTHQQGPIIDRVYNHNKRVKGPKVVAIGGGTGLPSVLRGLKTFTSNITAIVTVADDGGSSGRLRRDLGVLPPGDLRNNIAALADDESLMTRLFQYRFQQGDLNGHSFGNLFITALSGVTGSLETALVETERVLNIQGRVFPATLQDVTLVASVRMVGERRAVTIRGESKISEAGGHIEQLTLSPQDAAAYSGSIQAILNADIVVIGPGSLYTSILPNILVKGIAEALRATNAYKVYVCNIATQPGETGGYTVAEHILALEQHIGRGVFQVILANNAYPLHNAGENTVYVQPVPEHHEVLQRYEICYTDLVDTARPWRHDSRKLGLAIIGLSEAERTGFAPVKFALANAPGGIVIK
ncbi:MAG: YvcK family protein [Chloroflexi bacterium]|nr:YvcK family protein [Chloroflexota bacterium]